MKVLVATSPGAGHVFPLVPLTWALRSAGHDVLVATAGRGLTHAAGAGLPCVDIAPDLDMDAVLAGAARATGDADPVSSSTGFERALAIFTEVSDVMLAGARRTVAAWRPDLVVHGALQGAGRWRPLSTGCPPSSTV